MNNIVKLRLGIFTSNFLKSKKVDFYSPLIFNNSRCMSTVTDVKEKANMPQSPGQFYHSLLQKGGKVRSF